MLRPTLAAVALALAPHAVPALGPDAPPAPVHFSLVSAGPGVYAAIAKDGDRESLGNAGFVVGDEAVLVVDAFGTETGAQELLQEVRRAAGGKPVRWVVNTHYHYDHTGGDAVFSRAGAAVVAHENVRAWVRTENLKFRKEVTPEFRRMVEALVLPDVTHRDRLTIWLGGNRRVEVLAKPGHTGGDSIVWVPDAGVLFAGDLLWKTTAPNLIDASTDAWVETLGGFVADYPAATYVPGHGPLAKALDVRYFRDYLFGLRSGVSRAIGEGKSGAALVEALLPAQKEKFGKWSWFDAFGARNLELTEQELRGTKKLPQPPKS